jgi:hypothetical protein
VSLRRPYIRAWWWCFALLSQQHFAEAAVAVDPSARARTANIIFEVMQFLPLSGRGSSGVARLQEVTADLLARMALLEQPGDVSATIR